MVTPSGMPLCTKLRLPLRWPAWVGWNSTSTVQALLTAKLVPQVPPCRVNSAEVLTVMLLSATRPVRTVKVCLALVLPTGVLAKLRAVGALPKKAAMSAWSAALKLLANTPMPPRLLAMALCNTAVTLRVLSERTLVGASAGPWQATQLASYSVPPRIGLAAHSAGAVDSRHRAAAARRGWRRGVMKQSFAVRGSNEAPRPNATSGWPGHAGRHRAGGGLCVERRCPAPGRAAG